MKKLFFFTLIGAFLIALSSCGSSDENQVAGNEDTTTVQAPETQQGQPVTGENEQTEQNENQGEKQLVKPDHFPKTGIDDLGDIFAEENILDGKNFEEILTAWQAIQDLGDKIPADLKFADDTAKAILSKTVGEHGFESWKAYQGYLTVMVTSMMALPTLVELENVKGKNAVAYDMTKQIAASIVAQGHISKDDLRFVYDHWDESKTIVDEINKSKPEAEN